MALQVAINGNLSINQGGQTTLTAVVTDSDSNIITAGLQYAWTAGRGSFVGATDGASAVYRADFTDASDIEVDITCEVTLPANPNPTVSTGSLTAMTELGITGQILNMYIDETEASARGRNKVIYAAGSADSSLAAGSDDDITNAINTWRVQWQPNPNRFILNNDGSGDLGGFFASNTAQSVFLIFSDGTTYEITNAEYDAGSTAWVRWTISDASIATKLDDLAADDTLLVGVGDAGSIGLPKQTGTGTAQVTAAASLPPPPGDAVLKMTVNPSSVPAGGSATVTFTFNKSVGGFTDTDVRVSAGATKGTLTDEGNNVWTMPVTAPSSGGGTVTVSVEADAVSPGNNAESVSFTYTVPRPPPLLVRGVPQVSNAAVDVNVEVTPTTALMTWKAPTNGASLTGYEISYSEGTSPGTTWIPTGSRSTRFFVKGLKRGTHYTWQVRGVTENGVGPASRPVTVRTPIASLHNALFFKECVNYLGNGERISEYGNPSNVIRAAGDNDYRTFTREKDLVLNIAVGGNPTRVDAVVVKGIGIEGHSAEPMGGTGVGYSNRMMPAMVKNWEGTDVSTIVNGFQHDLYLLDGHFTATSVRMTFTGVDAKIYEVMLLEFGLEIDANSDFTQIDLGFMDRTGVIHPDAGSGIQHTPTLGSDRDKWQVDYVVKVVPGKTILETPEEFLYWRAENKNHVFAMEPSRFPWRIFPAVFVGKSVPVRYRTDDKTGGEILSFRVSEQ